MFDIYTTRVRGQRKFATDKPQAEGRKVYQWQTSNDRGQGEYICRIQYGSHGSYDIYYGDVMLVMRMLRYTTKCATKFSTHCISA